MARYAMVLVLAFLFFLPDRGGALAAGAEINQDEKYSVAPELELPPNRIVRIEEAKFSYAAEVLKWARAQKLPDGFPHSTNGELTRVETKLLDAMVAVSSI